jgi:hypothetical protein
MRRDDPPWPCDWQCKRAAAVGQFCKQHAAMDAAGKAVLIWEYRRAPEDSA